MGNSSIGNSSTENSSISNSSIGNSSIGNSTAPWTPWSPGPEWFAQRIFHYVFSFVFVVLMTNIFIGHMCSAYDCHSAQVVQLFVRVRAQFGLNFVVGWDS